ncbi:MAG: hypothetical protein WAM53_04035, partial [Terrimicrobiaceae bacterium]
ETTLGASFLDPQIPGMERRPKKFRRSWRNHIWQRFRRLPDGQAVGTTDSTSAPFNLRPSASSADPSLLIERSYSISRVTATLLKANL